MRTQSGYVQGWVLFWRLGAEIFPRLVPADSWIHPPALQCPCFHPDCQRGSVFPLGSHPRFSSCFHVTPLLKLRLSFARKTQISDLVTHYLNHFLLLSFLLNHRYLMTACKLNMCMLWDCYVEKNNLEVLDSFIASYRSSLKQSGIKHGLSFPIIGYSTSKYLYKNKGTALNTQTSLRASLINPLIKALQARVSSCSFVA